MRTKYIAFTLLLAMFATPAFAQTDALIARIKQADSTVKTIESDFSQTKTLKMMNRTIQSEGRLFYDRDFYLNMVYTKPDKNQILIDGNRFIVTKGMKTNRFNTDNSTDMRLFRNALINSFVGNIQEIADENGAGIEYSRDKENHIFSIVSKSGKKRMYNGFVIYYDIKTLRMKQITILESNGNYTDYILTGTASVNKPFSEPQKRTE
ncbi:MAG: outer membrane lipoprotein carrier protein LolA [Candidatus Aphodosoma sp.]